MMEELKVLMTAMLPVLELRGAIPLGILLGLSPLKAYILSVVGNFIPVPFILLLLRKILNFLERFGALSSVVERIYTLGERRSELVRKYGPLGLTLFVAIPLPVTGAWTGSLVATLLNLPLRTSLVSILAGILIAGLIVLSASMGVISLF
ncbi:MAG: small multi-drug export protein [Archaeoglobi archaeon]|nr:small multi-drug export protein [Candidatus Mnemosynella bozhongmuii]